jgi:Lipocalin-like domain
MTKEQFAGTWRLVSTEHQDSNGRLHHPYGENPMGILVYDSDGHMSVQIMRRDRPAIAAIDSGTPEEIRAAFIGYAAYFGTYDVNEQDGSVVHHLEASLLPWVGGDQKRLFTFSGNRLTLRPPPRVFGGVMLSGHLVWERVSPPPEDEPAPFSEESEPATEICTLGGPNKRTRFAYEGNVSVGVTLLFKTNSFISPEFFKSILKHFAGKTVRGGFSMTSPPHDGLGYWVSENSARLNGTRLLPRHASFIAAILVHEGLITGSLTGAAVMLHFPAKP